METNICHPNIIIMYKLIYLFQIIVRNIIHQQRSLMFATHTNINRRDIPSPNITSSSNSRKKIKDYSYLHIDRIGKGFSSIVYKGINDITNEIVAIKAIDMKGVKDAISRQMLQCQIEALKTLNHDNILKCFDVVRQPSHCYIVTEFCNQGDLSGLLKKKRRLTQAQTSKILKDIVSGFIEIGQKGFLHRDLKLANIFLNDGKAKIADFGFAKKNKFASEKEKYNVGSPLYMSPEALKKNIYSLKNDIWSIGVMTYELLHGETPWQCKTEKQLMDKMTRVPVRFRDSLDISEQLKGFIKKCLQVDETRRMSLQDLKDWINGNRSMTQSVNALSQRLDNLPPKLNLSHKPESNIEKLSIPSYKIDNSYRLTSRSQKQGISNKENAQKPRSSGLGSIPKSTIEKNNSVLVNEINTFRLLYKILEKVNKNYSNETQVIRRLGQQVIKRVSQLKQFCETLVDKKGYGLKMAESYFNERTNPSVKKYKSVVLQYFKKYTSQINERASEEKVEQLFADLKSFMERNIQNMTKDEDLVTCYWMIQLRNITKETSKQRLDGIIQPKLKLNKGYIEQRIKEID